MHESNNFNIISVPLKVVVREGEVGGGGSILTAANLD